MKVALISDNHGFEAKDELEDIIKTCDEVWHAGDIGSLSSIQWIKEYATLRGVYGNIDDEEIRGEYPKELVFTTADVKVYMIHIGGYPGKMLARVKKRLKEEKPHLYICGHSHILKVMPDRKLNLLHMNPGAYGHQGFHVIRTILTFEIKEGRVVNLNAVELGRRGKVDDDYFEEE